MIAAVLHLHEHRGPVLNPPADAAHFPHAMISATAGFFRLLDYRKRHAERRARIAPALPAHLVSLPTTRHLGHSANIGWVCAAQAGDDDARAGALALSRRMTAAPAATARWSPAQLLMKWYRQGRRTPPHGGSLGFEGIEAAARGDDVDAHRQARFSS